MNYKFYVFIFIISSYLLHSQNYKIVYELTYKPDSANLGLIKKEYFELNVDADLKESNFFIFDQRKDSIKKDKQNSLLNTGTINIKNDNPLRFFPTNIKKNYISNGQIFYYNINDNLYGIESHKILDWSILNSVENFMNYKTTKASLTFGGRKWEAFFTNDIPINDGPYSFCGLPGLILKINDSKNEFIFQVISIEQTKEKPNLKLDKTINVEENKLRSVLGNYYKDPFKLLKEGYIIDKESGMKIHMKNGFEKSFIKEQEAKFNQFYKENNNCIFKNDVFCTITKTLK